VVSLYLIEEYKVEPIKIIPIRIKVIPTVPKVRGEISTAASWWFVALGVFSNNIEVLKAVCVI
jgi:hypothetical protein